MTDDQRSQLRVALRANATDLLGYFEMRVDDREDAADLLSELMMTAWRRLEALPESEPVRQRMWLYGIASRTLANHRRGRRRFRALLDRMRGELHVEGDSRADTAEVVAVRDAVNHLPEQHRELVRLVHWDGLTVSEAAEVLGLNPSTARGRYSAAKSSLRAALGDDIDDPPQRRQSETIEHLA